MNFAEGTLNLFTSLCVPVLCRSVLAQAQWGDRAVVRREALGHCSSPKEQIPAAPGASRAPSLQPSPGSNSEQESI